MERAIDVKRFILNDEELSALVRNSKHLRREYHPRNKKRSKASLALDYFWSSEDGMTFRDVFEQKTGLEMSQKLRGLVKEALLMIFVELMGV